MVDSRSMHAGMPPIGDVGTDGPSRRRRRAVNRFATTELVVEFSLLTRCEPALARALAALRMQRLVAGARVELHHAPPELTRRLGHAPAEVFDVAEAGT